MSEWSKEHDWKSCEVHASEGSNPSLCAISELYESQIRTFLFIGLLWSLHKNMI